MVAMPNKGHEICQQQSARLRLSAKAVRQIDDEIYRRGAVRPGRGNTRQPEQAPVDESAGGGRFLTEDVDPAVARIRDDHFHPRKQTGPRTLHDSVEMWCLDDEEAGDTGGLVVEPRPLLDPVKFLRGQGLGGTA